MQLSTNDHGILRFAAISRTALGTRAARADELAWFYSRLPHYEITTVLHLGGLGDDEHYPVTPGVRTFLTSFSEPLGGHHDARSLDRVSPAFWVKHAPTGRRMRLETLYDELHTFSALASNHSAAYANRWRQRLDQAIEAGGPRGPSPGWADNEDELQGEIVLVGGHRRVTHRYYGHERCFIGSVGVFDSQRRYRRVPLAYGGSFVEIRFHPSGLLDTCTLQFRDMSARLPD